MNDVIDREDWKKLLSKVLLLAKDDLIQLAHPSTRIKKYLDDAYQDSVDMFFDPEYRMEHILNEEGDAMCLFDLLCATIDNDLIDIEDLHKDLREGTMNYWDSKDVNTLIIPNTFVIEGTPWRVFHTDSEHYSIDFDESILHINKNSNELENQQQFFYAVTEIMFDALEIKISRQNLRLLSRGLFRMLKVNDCFTGATQSPKSTASSRHQESD